MWVASWCEVKIIRKNNIREKNILISDKEVLRFESNESTMVQSWCDHGVYPLSHHSYTEITITREIDRHIY